MIPSTLPNGSMTEFESQGDQAGVVKAGLRLAATHLAVQAGDQMLYWAKRVLPDLEMVEDVALQYSSHSSPRNNQE